MEPQAHLTRVVADRAMKGYIIDMLNIWKTLIIWKGVSIYWNIG
jgi:hypothetical protein